MNEDGAPARYAQNVQQYLVFVGEAYYFRSGICQKNNGEHFHHFLVMAQSHNCTKLIERLVHFFIRSLQLY